MKVSQEEFDAQLAQAIEKYWHDLGCKDVWCKARPTSMRIESGPNRGMLFWETVSNLVDGLPPGNRDVRIPRWERKPLRRPEAAVLEWPRKSVLRGGKA